MLNSHSLIHKQGGYHLHRSETKQNDMAKLQLAWPWVANGWTPWSKGEPRSQWKRHQELRLLEGFGPKYR